MSRLCAGCDLWGAGECSSLVGDHATLGFSAMVFAESLAVVSGGDRHRGLGREPGCGADFRDQ